MSVKILIMGLPGAGKTVLAMSLQKYLINIGYSVDWYNADDIRTLYNDWDFSHEGRIRQAYRMSELAKSNSDYSIVDFVAPLPEMRSIFAPDYLVWVDTLSHGRFEDTNKIFIPPEKYDFRITSHDGIDYSKIIGDFVRK